ncbi:MAG: hypothetical protein V9E94_11195 [Microthrixaceae bacterium]
MSSPEVAPPVPGALADQSRREWVSFEHNGDTYLFDASFLTSNWRCIFGQGCKGVLEEDATELGHGCCSHGAHLADKPDRERVKRQARRLVREQWQLMDTADELGGAFHKIDGSWTTRRHDGACIFLNRNDFHLGAGCALHVGALDAGESFLDWKPEVCWQVPLRFSHHVDEVDHTTYTLREWKRRDWGEGGAEFHWWCTDTDDAYVDRDPVVVTLREEIVALVGDEVYEMLLDQLRDRPAVTWVPHPSVRSNR